MIGTKAPESGGHSRHPYTPSAFNKHLKRGFSSATYGRESGGEVRREAGSEGYAEKYRAVVNGGYSKDEPVGQRQGRACTMEAKAFSSTHRNKVCAVGTVRKI